MHSTWQYTLVPLQSCHTRQQCWQWFLHLENIKLLVRQHYCSFHGSIFLTSRCFSTIAQMSWKPLSDSDAVSSYIVHQEQIASSKRKHKNLKTHHWTKLEYLLMKTRRINYSTLKKHNNVQEDKGLLHPKSN